MKKFFKLLYNRITKALQEQVDLLERQVEEFKQELEELKNPVIEIRLLDDTDQNNSPKSVRINFFVWKEWQDFCETHEDFSKKELVSMALKEYMEKHK